MYGIPPSTLAVLLGLAYLVWPIDVIPDLFGLVGRLDDIAVLAFVGWKLWKLKQEVPLGPGGTTVNMRREKSDRTLTPLEILELEPNATKDDIDARYRVLMKQYHPDRVAHLGPDLRNLAHEKTIEIQRAYAILNQNG